MRLLPLVIAVLVSVVLYLFIFQRDRLMDVAGGGATAPQDETAEASAESAAIEDQQDLPSTSVLVQKSVSQKIDRGVLLRGQTEAVRQVEVRAETAGTVISDPLRRGAEVAQGQLLCEIDPGTRVASLATARARLTEAEIGANAATKLSAGGFTSETAAASARAQLQAAEAGVEAAETEIGRLKITAPFAGLLESDAAETGSLLAAGGLCATVIQLDPIKLVAFVPETEVDRITVGANAGARLATGTEVVGQVTFLSRSADPDTRTFRVEVQVPNADMAIRDGQTVELLIAAAGGEAHLVPASSLTLNDDGVLGLRTVEDGHVVFSPVEVLRDSVEGMWVGGLPDEADVIVVGQEYVTDGVPVEVTYKEPPK